MSPQWFMGVRGVRAVRSAALVVVGGRTLDIAVVSGLRHVGGFRVIDSAATDGVEHSDGAAVTTAPLGARFPSGLLVVHDGENTPDVLDEDGEPRPNTNFKLLRLEQLARVVAE